MRLEPAPRIAGDAWLLRPIERTDVDAWFSYLSDPAVVAHSSWNVRDPSALHALVDDCESAAHYSAIRYAIVEPRTGAFAGSIGFPTVSWLHRTAEVAYDVNPAFAGRGIASACCEAITSWAIASHGFNRIQATALDTNVASQRVLAKCGFAFEGTLRKLKLVRGEPRDFNLYARTA